MLFCIQTVGWGQYIFNIPTMISSSVHKLIVWQLFRFIPIRHMNKCNGLYHLPRLQKNRDTLYIYILQTCNRQQLMHLWSLYRVDVICYRK